jgi:hypothetical protein
MCEQWNIMGIAAPEEKDSVSEPFVSWRRRKCDSHCLIDRKRGLHLHTSLHSTRRYPRQHEKQSFPPTESS